MNQNSISFPIVSWNVHGLSDTDKCTVVKDTLCSARPAVACLQESKLSTTSLLKSKTFLLFNLSAFSYVDASATRGGIVTAWDPKVFSLVSFMTRCNSLTTVLSSTASDYSSLTNVYAPVDHREPLAFLSELSEFATHISGPWLLIGDFNIICSTEENSNGSPNVTLCQAFNNTIDALDLVDIPLTDRLFTWSNHRSVPTLARLDRVLLNVDMNSAFPNSHLSSLPKPTSDHTSLLLLLSTSIPKSAIFRFENAWLLDPSFSSFVLPSWHFDLEHDTADAMVCGLKQLHGAAKVWYRRKRSPLHSYKLQICRAHDRRVLGDPLLVYR